MPNHTASKFFFGRFMKTGFILIVCCFSALWARGVDWDQWTDAQIERDFAPYQDSGITLEMLDKTMEWCAKWPNVATYDQFGAMVRFRVVDSQIYQTKRESAFDGQVHVAGLRGLEEMIRRYPVPDVDYIFFDDDGPLAALVAPDGTVAPGPVFASTKQKEFHNVILFHDWITTTQYNIDPKERETRDTGWAFANYDWAHISQEVEEGVALYPWEAKISKCFWRGRAIDHRPLTQFNYYRSPRVVMVALSMQYPELLDAAFVGLHFNHFLADIPGFPPLQPMVGGQEQLRFKYQITLDGAVSQFPGYAWRLLSNCLVFKADSPFIQWFEAGLVPGIHYLPVKRDLSDLLPAIKWAQEHDEQARQIAEEGRAFAKESITRDDMLFYAYKALLKHASLQRFQPAIPEDDSVFKLVSSPLSEEERVQRRALFSR